MKVSHVDAHMQVTSRGLQQVWRTRTEQGRSWTSTSLQSEEGGSKRNEGITKSEEWRLADSVSWEFVFSYLAHKYVFWELKPIIFGASLVLSTQGQSDVAWFTRFKKSLIVGLVNIQFLVLMNLPTSNKVNGRIFIFLKSWGLLQDLHGLAQPPYTWNLRNTAQLVQFIFKYPYAFPNLPNTLAICWLRTLMELGKWFRLMGCIFRIGLWSKWYLKALTFRSTKLK